MCLSAMSSTLCREEPCVTRALTCTLRAAPASSPSRAMRRGPCHSGASASSAAPEAIMPCSSRLSELRSTSPLPSRRSGPTGPRTCASTAARSACTVVRASACTLTLPPPGSRTSTLPCQAGGVRARVRGEAALEAGMAASGCRGAPPAAVRTRPCCCSSGMHRCRKRKSCLGVVLGAILSECGWSDARPSMWEALKCRAMAAGERGEERGARGWWG